MELKPKMLPEGDVEGFYVHVPFCFHKCHYCDFYSITRQSRDRMVGFVDLVLREADLWVGGGPSVKPRTVFFGGGTPSLLPLDCMKRLIGGLRERFDFSLCDEWTVEANPATVEGDYCGMLKDAGVTRMSFGAQTFGHGELKTLERHHDPEDVGKSVQMARAAGIGRINVDLIYGIPGQDLGSWARSLETALELGTPHVSCYGLTYEPNTPMAVKKRMGLIRAVDEEVELKMNAHTRRRLAEAGRPAYEVSNYAVAGEECRHNLMYWNGGNYVGLGPSAASHVRGWRWKNRPHLGEWEVAVKEARVPAAEVEELSPRHRAGELAMLMLRLTRGLEFDVFASRTGMDAREMFADPIGRFCGAGLLEMDERGVRLKESGWAVADGVAAEFLTVTGR